MPLKPGFHLYKVHMQRKNNGKKPIKISLYTQAKSREQARRFATHRKPGFSITKVVEEE